VAYQPSEKNNTGEKVSIIVNDDGCRPTMGERTLWKDSDGTEFVQFDGKYWEYPIQ